MPLGLKELETGHYVLFVVVVQMNDYNTTVFTRDEKLACRMTRYLRDHFHRHDCLASPLYNVFYRKEIVLFDGSVLHSLTGNKYEVAIVQSSLERLARQRLQDGAGDYWILAAFLEKPLKKRPGWQRVLIDLCCLCCYVNKSVPCD